MAQALRPGRTFVIACALAAAAVRPLPAAEKTQAFPDLEFVGSDGSVIKLSQFKGSVVVINFWATWCGPCRLELPQLQNAYNRYSDRNFVLLTINVDQEQNRPRIAPFMKKYNLSLPVYYGSPEATMQLTAMGIPSTYIIRPDGGLEKMFVGYDPGVEQRWKQHIEKYLRPARK